MIKIYFDNPPAEIMEKVKGFLDRKEAEYEVCDSRDDANLVIDFPGEREISNEDILHSGGRLACPTAFMVADNMGISKRDVGKLANILDIKIFGCQLGCFK